MDRPKIALAAIKKHHFWVLCGVVVAVGLVLWWTSTSSVDGQRTTRTAKITGDLNQMVQVVGINPHPNQKVIKHRNTQTVKNKEEILGAWKRLYDEQKEKNTVPTALGPDFKQEFEALEPGEDLEYEYLLMYREFIGRHIPKLFERADILRPAPVEEETPDPDAPGGPQPPTGPTGNYRADLSGRGSLSYGGPTGQGPGYSMDLTGEGGQFGPKMIGVVYWVPTDLAAFVERFNWPTLPTTRDVIRAQENLWVYEALLRIIKETNGRVKNRDDAAVKEIRALQIGGAAAAVLQGPEGGAYAAGQGSAGRANTVFEGYTPRAGPPESMTPTGPGPMGAEPYARPTESRYVDETGQRLEVDETDQPIYKDEQGQILGPGPYKLMPIRMLLLMNQTKLAKLLVECANSNMPVEVRSISMGMDRGTMLNMGFPSQIGPSSGRSDSGPGAGAYQGGRSSGYDAYPGRGPRAYGSSGVFGPTGASRPTGAYGSSGAYGSRGAVQRRTLDVPVEIRGTICIYNPPSEATLETAAAAGSPATLPPATPPAAAPTEPPPATPAPSGGAPGVAEPAGGQPPTTGQEKLDAPAGQRPADGLGTGGPATGAKP